MHRETNFELKQCYRGGLWDTTITLYMLNNRVMEDVQGAIAKCWSVVAGTLFSVTWVCTAILFLFSV